MPAFLQLLLTGLLAWQLHRRLPAFRDFPGLPGLLFAFGLTFFLVTWADFAAWTLLGWSPAFTAVTWLSRLAPVTWLAIRPSRRAAPPPRVRPSLSFLFFAAFVLTRFALGLTTDSHGRVWSNFNFVDTAFHLSIAQSFLAAPHFPPADLNMAGFPLKYHFLADFALAHTIHLGLRPLPAVALLNLLAASALAGALWSVFENWLRLPPRWTLLAAVIFLFLNPALLNLLHLLALDPPYLDPNHPFDGLLFFPYFNFEGLCNNLLEPQRAFLFVLPVALFVLHLAFAPPIPPPGSAASSPPHSLLLAFALVCLLPFANVVAFALLVPCLLPALWRHRAAFLARWPLWVPVFAVGLLQLYYVRGYGPPGHPDYAAWDATACIPLDEFTAFPAFLRRLVFWFFVDGDFLGWGLLFLVLAVLPVRFTLADPAAHARLRAILRRWLPFLLIAAAFFLLINFYRYTFNWSDSNKFVLFLDLGLTLLIVPGAALWLGTRRALLSHALWTFFLTLSLSVYSWEIYLTLRPGPPRGVLLFPDTSRRAAVWLSTHTAPGDLILAAARDDIHFVTALAGRPVLHGLYASTSAYRQDDRPALIQHIYEQADFSRLRPLGVRYVCISRSERLLYHLAPAWAALMRSSPALVFHTGDDPDAPESVYIFDATRLE